MIEMHLKVGQADGTSLGPKGLVKHLIEINNNHFEHLFIVCQNFKKPLLFGMDFAQHYKIGLIGIIQEHHTCGIRVENRCQPGIKVLCLSVLQELLIISLIWTLCSID